MRYVATSLLLASFTVLSNPLQASSSVPGAAESTASITPFASAEQSDAQKAFGVLEETPNQRRIRLGQPIVESFPAQEYGELLETPNQQRARLQALADAQTALKH